MVKRTHGYRFKCRKLLSKTPRERGRPGLMRWMIKYDVGDKVVIDVDPTNVETAPHRRYQGKVGTVIGKRGDAYLIEVYLGGKRKIVITTPNHIKPLNLEEKIKQQIPVLKHHSGTSRTSRTSTSTGTTSTPRTSETLGCVLPSSPVTSSLT